MEIFKIFDTVSSPWIPAWLQVLMPGTSHTEGRKFEVSSSDSQISMSIMYTPEGCGEMTENWIVSRHGLSGAEILISSKENLKSEIPHYPQWNEKKPPKPWKKSLAEKKCINLENSHKQARIYRMCTLF